MKKIVTSFGLIVIPFFKLCSQSLNQDPLIHYYFSKEEVNQLQSVVGLFNEFAKRDCHKTVAECIARYSEDLGSSLTERGALLDSSAMFAFRDRALSTLSDSLTYTIWEYTYGRSRISSTRLYHQGKIHEVPIGCFVYCRY